MTGCWAALLPPLGHSLRLARCSCNQKCSTNVVTNWLKETWDNMAIPWYVGPSQDAISINHQDDVFWGNIRSAGREISAPCLRKSGTTLELATLLKNSALQQLPGNLPKFGSSGGITIHFFIFFFILYLYNTDTVWYDYTHIYIYVFMCIYIYLRQIGSITTLPLI